MKTIIAGSRGFCDYGKLCSICEKFNITEVVSGTAPGADRLGEKYAIEKGILIKRFPGDWIMLGKRAGFVRNVQMANYADALIAFWDGQSKGTKIMINEATKRGLFVMVYEYNKKTISIQTRINK